MQKQGPPIGGPVCYLAAAAVVVAAATIVLVVAAAQAVIATAAEQDQKDDDPANVATAETVIIHSKYLQRMMTVLTASFQGIPLLHFCESKREPAGSLYFNSQSFTWLAFS